jgi:hypothetical protein
MIENLSFINLYSKSRCHAVLKAISISKNTAAVNMLLLKLKVTWSISLIHWSVMLWWAVKPNWLALSRPLYSMYLRTIFRITFSNSLPVIDKRLIECKFWGNLWSLPDFSNIITFASFHGFGKWDSQRHWLNKRVRCTSGLLGRYLRYSFGIPTSTQAFLNLNEFANLCMSHGLTFPNGVSSADASRAWTVLSTCHSWLSSHRS